MGEIWPKKKSAGRRSIIEGSVHRFALGHAHLLRPEFVIEQLRLARGVGGSGGKEGDVDVVRQRGPGLDVLEEAAVGGDGVGAGLVAHIPAQQRAASPVDSCHRR